MNPYLVFHAFLSYLSLEREKVAHRRLEQIAKSEEIDDFQVVESSELGVMEYSTTHGFRVLYRDRPQINQFVVAKKGNGFAKARNLPYIYLQTLCEPSQLIVESPCIQATAAGYTTAVRLPIAVAGKIDEYPEGTMIVRITEDSEASVDSGYANAVPLPYSRESVYIQKIDMLDTEYAAMLDNEPRF